MRCVCVQVHGMMFDSDLPPPPPHLLDVANSINNSSVSIGVDVLGEVHLGFLCFLVVFHVLFVQYGTHALLCSPCWLMTSLLVNGTQ